MNNDQAFTNLVRRQRSTIYTVCYMFSSDQDEVNDLFQEVLIRLWQGWETFRGDSNERTWVYRIALNTCISIDRSKKAKRHHQQLLDGVDLFDDSRVLGQSFRKTNRLYLRRQTARLSHIPNCATDSLLQKKRYVCAA